MRGLILLLLLLSLGSSLWAEGTSEDNGSKSDFVRVDLVGIRQLDPEEIYRAIGVELHPWYAFWSSDERLLPRRFVPALSDTLRAYLDSQGFYDATFRIRREGDRVRILIDEKRPVRVSEVNVSSDFPIRGLVRFKKGDRFSSDRFREIKQAIRQALLKDGYCSYDLDTKAYVDLARRSVSLVYRLNKGAPCRFGNTTILKHPESVPPEVILSRLQWREGERFGSERIKESYAALNALGLFDRVLIDTQKKYFNVVRPEISTRLSSKLHRYVLAVGYDSAVGFRTRASYRHFNWLGGGRSIGTVGEYSRERKRLELQFLQPALWRAGGLFFDLDLLAGYRRERYRTYREHTAYLDGRLSHRRGAWSAQLGMRVEHTRITKTAEDEGVIGGEFRLLSPYLRLTYDTRDSKIDPRNGLYLSGYGEFGLSANAETTRYYKLLTEFRLIHTFGFLTLAAVGKAGVLEDYGHKLPASKYLYAGGPFSNRAYGRKKISRTLTPTSFGPLGGHSWLNFSLEADFPIYAKLSGALFYDATMIAERPYRFDAAWVESVGVGVRYSTPIGPFKIDFAFNPHRLSANRISVMVGQSF